MLGIVAAWGARVGWQALVDHPALVVREVTVTGLDVTPPAEILELAAVAEGESWLGLDRGAVALRVRAHPFVGRVRVRRPWPGRVRIDVVECVPVARVQVKSRTYGLCEDLRILPGRGERDEELPLLRTDAPGLDPELLARGLQYLRELDERGVGRNERIEIVLGKGAPDRIRFLQRGFAATVEHPVPPDSAARNVAAFLETLDETGEARGTLQVISESTAVWRAA